MTALGLVLLTGATYGLAWTLSRSKLSRVVQMALPSRGLWRLARALLGCIVCTSWWASWPVTGLASVAGWWEWSFAGALVLSFWAVATAWVIGLVTGDAS